MQASFTFYCLWRRKCNCNLDLIKYGAIIKSKVWQWLEFLRRVKTKEQRYQGIRILTVKITKKDKRSDDKDAGIQMCLYNAFQLSHAMAHHTGPTLWVTGFNIQLPRPYPKPSESHLGRTRWFYARMQPEAESWCGWLSVPAATAVFLLLLPLTLPWAW